MKKELAGFKFITEKGFVSELSTTAVSPVVESTSVVSISKPKDDGVRRRPSTPVSQEPLDIPDFMKEWQRNKKNTNSNVVHIDFPQQEEPKRDLADKLDDAFDAFEQKVYNSKLFKYFFDVEEGS